jgi:hypothetical protein
MNLNGRTVWQHAAGDTDRDYVDVCIENDVILNGPGRYGPWPAQAEDVVGKVRRPKKLTDLRRFCEEMLDGDVVVLRLGTKLVPAVGVIVGDYEWSDAFGDVDGWDLEHVRRIKWLWVGKKPKEFDAYAIKWGDTTQRLNPGQVWDWLTTLKVDEAAAAEPSALPSESDAGAIEFDQISDFLFDRGVASTSIAHLMAEIGELTRIARWYELSTRNGFNTDQHLNRPSEHETVAYLVVPLLRALGWTPQRMAVEWNKVDVALFDSLPRTNENMSVVVEAKKLGRACLAARVQATGYADQKASCRRLIVTDGLRYGVYVKQSDGDFRLHAYLNLTRLRDGYPAYDCGGAEDALLAMSPDWRKGHLSD